MNLGFWGNITSIAGFAVSVIAFVGALFARSRSIRAEEAVDDIKNKLTSIWLIREVYDGMSCLEEIVNQLSSRRFGIVMKKIKNLLRIMISIKDNYSHPYHIQAKLQGLIREISIVENKIDLLRIRPIETIEREDIIKLNHAFDSVYSYLSALKGEAQRSLGGG